MRPSVEFERLGDLPIVAAPMAGGPSTTDLVVAVAEAGGLSFVPAGYKTAAAVDAQLREVATRTSRPFGVNLFVPGARRATRRQWLRTCASSNPKLLGSRRSSAHRRGRTTTGTPSSTPSP